MGVGLVGDACERAGWTIGTRASSIDGISKESSSTSSSSS
jgi:hypothetical protein